MVVSWGRMHSFNYPWRKSKDPYRVLLAEVMLQRTKADQVVPVYEKFVREFPSAETLVQSTNNYVRTLLKPLGLDYRAARLRLIAKIIEDEHQGAVPRQYERLKSIPGIGEYITNAIRCFAYDERVPLIDANIARILGRVFSIKMPREPHKQKNLWKFIDTAVPVDSPKLFNWALIDIGRTICTPRKPRCSECPLYDICDYARHSSS